MVATTVHLLRHGEVHNPTGILYGRMPGYHLSDLGSQMAHMVAADLAAREVDLTYLVSSPLERAQQTALPVAESFDLPVQLDDRVIEAGNWFEGKKFTISMLRRPEVLWRVRNPFSPSWGEPYKELSARMVAAIDDARDAAQGHHALIVSHQLPIWIARLAAEKRSFVHDPRRRQCNLASLTSLTFHDQTLESVSYREPAAELYPHSHRGASGLVDQGKTQ